MPQHPNIKVLQPLGYIQGSKNQNKAAFKQTFAA